MLALPSRGLVPPATKILDPPLDKSYYTFVGKRATGKLTKGGVAVTSAIEAVLAAEDIYRLYRMSEEGRISEEKFVEAVLHRLVTTVGSVWGSCVGGAMGGAAAGLPGFWLGGFLGNLLGGTIFGLGYDVALSLLESFNAKLE